MDVSFRRRVMREPYADSLLQCYNCSGCTSGCPAARLTSFNPRRLARMAYLGVRGVLRDETLWLCMNCLKCSEYCPQDVSVKEIIRGLQRLAREEGVVSRHGVYRDAFVRSIHRYGRVFELEAFKDYYLRARDLSILSNLGMAMSMLRRLPKRPEQLSGEALQETRERMEGEG